MLLQSYRDRPSGGRPRAGTRSFRLVLSVLVGALVLPVVALRPPPAAAYQVCPDGNCVHEYVADRARVLLFSNSEMETYKDDIIAGVTEEDTADHVYGLKWVGDALITITHFWDADKGPNDPVEIFGGEFPNSWQKAQALWSMALGFYAKGDKKQAYHYLGHVAHFPADMTLPAHVKEDTHPKPIDDDSYELWMTQAIAALSPAEEQQLKKDGPLPVSGGSYVDRLHYVLYTNNQIADFFASDDVDGDTVDPLGLVQPELAAMAAITSPRTEGQLDNNDDDNDNDDGDLGRIRQYSYMRAFRGIAAVYKLFAEAVAKPITSVVVDRVEELKDHDFICPPVCFETSDPDFWARVVINGLPAQNRGNYIENEIITPDWPFGNSVGTAGAIPIRIEIWDTDSQWTTLDGTGNPDDQSDITPGPGRSLDLTVDLAKCLSGADGAISGGASGRCGVPITTQGDTDNDEVSKLTFTIRLSKATPAISTQASPANLLGAPVRDTATLTGGASPTGDVTFRLFSNNTCTAEVYSSTNAVVGSAATSGWFTPAATGTYFWTAVYNGDASNNPVTSPCNAPNESVVIRAFEPPPFTRIITGDLVGPVTVNASDSVQISNARVVGPVTVNPGGALVVVNSKISRGIAANAPGFLSLCGTQISGPSPNQALGVSNAPVPIRIGDPANGCGGNEFAGEVNLSTNLAVTFGANKASQNVNVINGGPGNTVIKANTVIRDLGCAANNPPPTNADQVNSAGSKTGQCAAL